MSLIIAVAGHIDHGKTALVRALTGIETDRLPEERRRGISIEAGFAHWRRAHASDLPPISFVDVPGHERYISNMVAGIQGARAALLVIACDDGVMPQTCEHAEILRLMGIRQWVVALTKSDRIDSDQLSERTASIQEWLQSEAIEAEVIPVSAHTGEGIAELASRIQLLAEVSLGEYREIADQVPGEATRLCVDRSFIAAGDGLVVTGVLVSGVLRVGDAVRVSPAGLAARVRGLQRAGQSLLEVQYGSRCAVNLAGQGIDRQSVGRGDWIVSSELHRPICIIDVQMIEAGSLDGRRVRCAWEHTSPGRSGADHPTRRPAEVQVHAGTARLSARIAAIPVPAAAERPDRTWIRLRLARPVSAVVGDRWILRSSDGTRTLGMAEVVWPVDATDGLRGAAHVTLLQGLNRTHPGAWLSSALARLPGGMAPARFAAAWGLTLDAATACWKSAGAVLLQYDGRGVLFDQNRLDDVRVRLGGAVHAWHQQHPESLGMDWAELMGKLDRLDTRRYASIALSSLQAAGELMRHGDRIFRPDHVPAPSAEDEIFRLRVLPLLTERRSRSVHELADMLAMPLGKVRLALDRLALQGYAVSITPQRYLAIAQIEALAAAAVSMAESGDLRAGDFSRATGIGRNLGIDVLEFFDRIRLTRRLRDRRIVIDNEALQRVLRVAPGPVTEMA
ncbi:MAG: selenocysteine-specific translation elongation factor [Betaproteobacteria bacterium]